MYKRIILLVFSVMLCFCVPFSVYGDQEIQPRYETCVNGEFHMSNFRYEYKDVIRYTPMGLRYLDMYRRQVCVHCGGAYGWILVASSLIEDAR